jgi:arabinofuranosyltransferase
MTRPKLRPLMTAGFTLPFAVVLLFNVRRYFPFLSDDALISLRYARRLLDGHGLTWTDGPRVEGYSNLLWVLLTAMPGLAGVDLIAAARALGIAGMVLALGAVAGWYGTRGTPRVGWFPATVGQWFLAAGAPIAVWAIGGLEAPLVAALLAFAIPLGFAVLDAVDPPRPTVATLSLVLGLLCLTRPDGPIFSAAAAAALLIMRRSVALAARVLIMPALLSAAQLAFRLAYYGELVPNTALVKIAPTTARWIFGWEYVAGGVAALAPFSWLAIASMIVLLVPARTRGRALFLGAPAVAWTAYLVFIGGDIFPAYRHFVPLMVIFAFALAEGAREIAERLAARPLYLYAVVLVIVALFPTYAQRQNTDKHSVRAIRERWEWQGKEVALLLKRAFERQRPLLAVTAAGCLPYWSELPSLDMLGLNDYYLPRHPPADMGTGFLGHELGDASYVLDREPDMIVFTVGSPPEFRVGQQLAANPDFEERYIPVTIRTRPLEYTAIIYFNKHSNKLGMGIIHSYSTTTIPGFLFTGEGAVAQLNSAGTLVGVLDGARTVKISFRTERTLADTAVEVRTSPPADVSGELVQNGNRVTVTVRSAGGEAVELEEVVLRKP